jgi:hypothetical protein
MVESGASMSAVAIALVGIILLMVAYVIVWLAFFRGSYPQYGEPKQACELCHGTGEDPAEGYLPCPACSSKPVDYAGMRVVPYKQSGIQQNNVPTEAPSAPQQPPSGHHRKSILEVLAADPDAVSEPAGRTTTP